jgi:hypothetical protein
MVSYLRQKFDTVAPVKATAYTDDKVKAVYEFEGVTVSDLRVIKRDNVQEIVETDRGWQEEEQTTILIGSNQDNTAWKSVDKVRLFGTFLIGDDPVAWAVDGREGRGVETHSETFIVVHLYRVTQEVSGDQSVRRQ